MTRERSGIAAGICALVGALIAVLLTWFIAPFPQTGAFVSDEYRYGPTFSVELADIPIMIQETAYTCNVVSMAIARNYLGTETTEYDIRTELGVLERGTGMLPKQYLKYANQAFAPLGMSVTLENPTTHTEILNTISDSLLAGLPVAIFYSALDEWNLPAYNTHYAVIYGIDFPTGSIKLSNPYGHLDVLSFSELYRGLDFTTYADTPLTFRLARKLGIVQPNSIFVLHA